MKSMRTFPLALVLAVVAALGCGAAHAGPPSPALSSTPSHINLTGATQAGADPQGEFVVTLRDYGGDPYQYGVVWVILPVGSSVRFATDPVVSGQLVDCTERGVRVMSDASGIVSFRIIGAGRVGPPSISGDDAEIWSEGMLLRTVGVGAFDLDGASGVGGADFSIWLEDFGASLHPARSDYDGNGVVGGADMSMLLDVFGAGGSSQSGTSFCP